MSGRIRDHLRSNVVGYVALFFVLTGGTAYALDGSNTVFSDDIVNGEVKTADIDTGSVTNGKLGTDAVKSNKILDGSVKNADLEANSVDSSNVVDNSLRNVYRLLRRRRAADRGLRQVGAERQRLE